MILFDGIDIQSVASIKVEDVRVSSIKYSPLSRSRATSPGSVFVLNRPASRTVSITFALLKEDRMARQAALDAIAAWAKTDKEYKLELPGHPDHYLTAVCTEKPDPSLRQWWESKLRLVFTCFDDPFWNAKTEKSVACGTTFYVLGDASPRMRIERTLAEAATNQTYTHVKYTANTGDILETMNFSTIPAGNMVIDLDRQTAKVGTTDIMQYYNVNSRFIVPITGSQSITGTGTVKYRERFS